MARLPAGMRKTTRGTFESRFTIEGKRYSVYGQTVQECREKEAARRREIEEGRYKPGRELTLDQFHERWEAARFGTIAESTIRYQKYLYRIASEVAIDGNGTTLGSMKLSKIERQNIRDVQKTLAEKVSVGTVNLAIVMLHGILKAAVEERLILWNPGDGVKKIKPTEKPARETIHRALSEAETIAFFEAAEARHSWYINLYEFMLNTGCRVGEAGALMPKDIKGDVLRIERTLTKSVKHCVVIGDSAKTYSSVRNIPIRFEARSAIATQRRLNAEIFDDEKLIPLDGSEKPIFRAPRGGLLQNASVNEDIWATCKAAGIEKFSVHAFRDTFATRAIESGMQPRTLQEILGHANIGITMNLYAHVMPETLRDQMDAVNVKRRKQA